MAGLGLALIGLVVVIGPPMTGSPARALGDLLFVAGAACWAAYSVLSRAATVRFHPVAATLAAAAFGAAVFAPLALLERGWEPVLAATPRALASVVYLGAFGTVVAFVAFSEGIRRIGAPRASAFIVLVPLLGEVLAFWLLGRAGRRAHRRRHRRWCWPACGSCRRHDRRCVAWRRARAAGADPGPDAAQAQLSRGSPALRSARIDR